MVLLPVVVCTVVCS
uniref:Uncharacterized protein n=1 Tax=Arundo donax TaxID=35708 RepID=A0A0A9G075_ARUDO